LVMYIFAMAGSDVMTDIFDYSLVAWMMIYFGLAGNITALQRAYMIWKSLP